LTIVLLGKAMLCSNSLLIQTIVVSRTLWPRFATQVFTGGCEPPVRGRGGRRRLERGPMSSPVVTSYRLPMVTIGVTVLSYLSQCSNLSRTDGRASGIGLTKGGTMHRPQKSFLIHVFVVNRPL